MAETLVDCGSSHSCILQRHVSMGDIEERC